MKQCKKCGVNINTNENFCPICYGDLKDVSGENVAGFFAEKKGETIVSKKRKKAIKILLFLNIFVISALIFINIKTKTEPWSLIVGLSCSYVWALVEHTILSHDTPFRKVFLQVLILSSIAFAINKIYSTTDWITNFVFPSLALAAMLFMAIYVLCDKQRKSKIFGFFMISILLMLVSMVMVVFKIDNFKTLNQINIIAQGLTCFAYILFCGRTILGEASKKFHI